MAEYQDIIEDTSKHEGLFDNITFYRFIIQSLPVGILTVSPQMKVTSLNPWGEQITGYSREEAMGHYCGDILQGGRCKLNCPLRTALDRDHSVMRIDTTIKNKFGEKLSVRMNTAALHDAEGNLLGAVEAFHDITHLKSLEREKDNLISMFAHDMKSSLTIIGGFVLRFLRKSGHLERKKEKEYLEIVKSESGKLDILMNDFLEFSRLQTGRLKLNFTAMSLDKEMMELFDAYQLKASEAGLRLELQNEKELPVIMGDNSHLRRVFTNLLDNAIKFSKDKGTITLSFQETTGEVMIRVEDEGIGISQEELPLIFDSFHRGKETEIKEGFGLGLASVKAIVEGHGGHVTAESEPGKGSVFTVILPKSEKSIRKTLKL